MSAATQPGRRTSAVAIASVNPLDHADEIKALFVAHGLATFPDFFDRTYPAAVRSGARSWLGRDEQQRIVMHQACLPRRFRSPHGDVVAGLMTNLVVAMQYRSFFPGVALLKRAVGDIVASGGIDFLYADPNVGGGVLLEAVGFTRVGTLQRYALPIADQHVVLDTCIRLFHVWLRATNGAAAGMAAVPHTAQDFSVAGVAVPWLAGPSVAAYHDPTLYTSRLAGYPTTLDWWLTLHTSHEQSGPPAAALMIRGPDASGTATLKAWRRARGGVELGVPLPGLIAELRRRGCRRLQISTIAESTFGRALRKAGFVRRPDTIPILAKALTPAGEACLAALDDWEITDLECDR
ncbi:MAG TPA: hypothetical protein VM716_06880 [Gemmatimonadales bacterium]|nr:hypothetical protein [Gemmatimonadales bacterium]